MIFSSDAAQLNSVRSFRFKQTPRFSCNVELRVFKRVFLFHDFRFGKGVRYKPISLYLFLVFNTNFAYKICTIKILPAVELLPYHTRYSKNLLIIKKLPNCVPDEEL